MNTEFENKLFEEIKLLEQGKQEAIKEIKKEIQNIKEEIEEEIKKRLKTNNDL